MSIPVLNLNIDSNITLTKNDDYYVIVKQDQNPVTVTGYTYYNFTGSGDTTVTTNTTGNITNVTIYSPASSGVTASEFAAFSASTVADIAYISGVTDTKLDIDDFNTFSGTTLPNTYALKVHTHPQYSLTGHTHSQYLPIIPFNSHTGDTTIHFTMGDITGFTSNSAFNTFTGTTLPNTYVIKTTINTLTGTTLPNTYATKSSISTLTGSTLPGTYLSLTNFNTYSGTTVPNTYATKSALSTYTGTTAPNTYATKSAINTLTGTTLPATYASKSSFESHTGDTSIHFTMDDINHANLSNLTWTSSGHIGTANMIPAFDSSGSVCETYLNKIYSGNTSLSVTTQKVIVNSVSTDNTFVIKNSGGTEVFQVDCAGIISCDGYELIEKKSQGIFMGTGDAHASYTSVNLNLIAGQAAGKNITTGYNNNIFGSQAGLNLTVGTFNTLIGGATGYFMYGGDYNTMVGYGAGYLNGTNGNYNSYFGYNSGLNNVNQSRNVYLGSFSGYRQTALSDALIIDNQDRGSASGETNNSLIVGTFNATKANQCLTINGATTISAANTGNTFIIKSGSSTIFNVNNVGNLFVYNIKSGADQASAGAAANEVWKTSGHATLPDNVLMIGV